MQPLDAEQDCGHLFCQDCIAQYADAAISATITPRNLSLPCPGLACQAIIGPSQIYTLLSPPMRLKYSKIQLLAFTADFQTDAKLETDVLVFCPDCDYGCF